MKPFIRLNSVQGKIILWTGAFFLVAIAVVIIFSAYGLLQTATSLAENQLNVGAERNAESIRAQFEEPIYAARNLAVSFGKLQVSQSPLSREQVREMLEATMLENPQFLGAWTLWEPNAFDGQDAQYVDSPDQVGGQTGRMLVVWSRGDQGQVILEDLPEDDGQAFYQCPKNTGRECFVEPYLYSVQGQDVLMTTAAAPVMVNGRFAGVVGIDVGLENLQTWADTYQEFEDQAILRLITYDGHFAAVKHDWEAVKASVESPEADASLAEVLPSIRRGEYLQLIDRERLSVYVPLSLGTTQAPWSVNVEVPRNVIYREANNLMWQQVGVGALFALAGLVMVWLLSMQIVRPVRGLTRVAEAVTDGRFDQRAEVVSNDEMGVLARAFNTMIDQVRQMLDKERDQRQYQEQTVETYVQYLNEVSRGNLKQRLAVTHNGSQNDPLVTLGDHLNNMTENLQVMIDQIREAAQNLTSASAEILAATSQQSAGATEQSAAISQTTTTVEEVKAISEQASARAQEVAESAQRTVNVARSGSSAVEETIESMRMIRDRVERISENLLALSEQTQQIGEIIATVNEISAQSNMLALNAAVEAARAGESGKGFAVVAAEVRSLAEQSRQATQQVKLILSEIQKATNTTVMATEEGTKGVEQGVALAARAQAAIEQLAGVINESAQIATQVMAGGQQQRTGVEQIALAMQNINQTTVQNLASVRQADQSAQNLNELAQRMNELIRQYNL